MKPHRQIILAMAKRPPKMAAVKPQTAMSTGAIWEAIGLQPLDQAVRKMQEDGWTKIPSNKEDPSCVFLRCGKKTARLYARNTLVGMVEFAHN